MPAGSAGSEYLHRAVESLRRARVGEGRVRVELGGGREVQGENRVWEVADPAAKSYTLS